MASNFGRGFKTTFAPTMSTTQQKTLDWVLNQPTPEQREAARLQLENLRGTMKREADKEGRDVELFPIQKKKLEADVAAQEALAEQRKRPPFQWAGLAGKSREEKLKIANSQLEQLRKQMAGTEGLVLQSTNPASYEKNLDTIAALEAFMEVGGIPQAPKGKGGKALEAKPAAAAKIRVQLKDGRKGSIDPGDFDAATMTKI